MTPHLPMSTASQALGQAQPSSTALTAAEQTLLAAQVPS